MNILIRLTPLPNEYGSWRPTTDHVYEVDVKMQLKETLDYTRKPWYHKEYHLISSENSTNQTLTFDEESGELILTKDKKPVFLSFLDIIEDRLKGKRVQLRSYDCSQGMPDYKEFYK